MDMKKEPITEYRTYKKRWLVLLTVMMLNISGAMLWLTFVSVAYRAAVFYETDLATINWLSLVFNLSGIFIGVVATYVLEKFGLKMSLLLSAWLSCAGAGLRIASTVETFSSSEKLAVLFAGQTLIALGQPFCVFAPPKTAATWFPDSQRALATTLGSIANPIGVVIAGITTPLFVDLETGNLDAFYLLITMAAPAGFSALLTTFVMTSSTPLIPPSAGANEKGGYFGKGIKEVLKNKNFLILVLAIGGGLGLYSTFATLLEQILCPFGYTSAMAGICAAMMTGTGVIGAAIIGAVVDRNKQFSTMVKLCYVITALGLIVFCIVFHIYMDYLILILIGCIGLFSFGIYPIGIELGIEATYPVGVATSSGLIMISGQIQSIVLVLILQSIGSVMSLQETMDYNSKCHTSSDEVLQTTTVQSFFNDVTSEPEYLPTVDLSVSVYVCGGYVSALCLLLVAFFRPKYNRMAVETRSDNMDSSFTDKSSEYSRKYYDNVSAEKRDIVSSL